MKSHGLILIAVFTLFMGCLQGAANYGNQVEAFTDLYKNGTMIAACDPNHCPAGRYADMVILNLEQKDPENGKRLRGNIVTNDPNVRAVLDKVVSKEVDAGFVYITDAYIEKDSLRVIEIPSEISPLPQYGIAVIADSKKRDEANLFIEFLISKEGQELLKEYGFLSAIESPALFESNKTSENALTIYAASSLTDVFTDAAERFENSTGIKVVLGFGSSGTLRQRIEGGATADVFATASLKHAELLIDEGFIGDYTVFVRNRLVVVAPR